jgi:hypothetical protein
MGVAGIAPGISGKGGGAGGIGARVKIPGTTSYKSATINPPASAAATPSAAAVATRDRRFISQTPLFEA